MNHEPDTNQTRTRHEPRREPDTNQTRTRHEPDTNPDTSRTRTRNEPGHEPDTNQKRTRTRTGHQPNHEPDRNRTRALARLLLRFIQQAQHWILRQNLVEFYNRENVPPKLPKFGRFSYREISPNYQNLRGFSTGREALAKLKFPGI